MRFGKFQTYPYLWGMSRYTINSENTESTKRAVRKFAKDIPVSNQYIKGVFTVKNYRKYQLREEVDVNFKGEIFVHWAGKKDWYDVTLMSKTHKGWKPSKIKVNRFIRKNLLFSLQNHLNFFCINIRHYSDITKMKWL